MLAMGLHGSVGPGLLAGANVLVTCDDGIAAPGLRALVKALGAARLNVFVSAPADERSGQSHSVTLSSQLSGTTCEVPGAVEGFAVHGTPADCVMLALCAPVFSTGSRGFDLVVSGINRGENSGLLVLYSGTVGAAREAAARGVPAIALSLDNALAHRTDDYAWAAHVSVCLVQATLQQLQLSSEAADHLQQGCLLNVNIPSSPLHSWAGLALTHQGSGYLSLHYKEVSQSSSRQDDDTAAAADSSSCAPGARVRVFRTAARSIGREDVPGCDNHALKRRWVSITPLWLKSDMPLAQDPQLPASAGATAVVADIIRATAAASGLPTTGLDRAAPWGCAAAAAPGSGPPTPAPSMGMALGGAASMIGSDTSEDVAMDGLMASSS